MKGTDKSLALTGPPFQQTPHSVPLDLSNDSLGLWGKGQQVPQQSGTKGSYGSTSSPRGRQEYKGLPGADMHGDSGHRCGSQHRGWANTGADLLTTHAWTELRLPKFLCWSTHPKVTIWRKEVIKVKWGLQGRALTHRKRVLLRDTRDRALSLPREDIGRRVTLQAINGAFTGNQTGQLLDLRLLILKNCEKTNCCGLSHPVSHILLWWPELTSMM